MKRAILTLFGIVLLMIGLVSATAGGLVIGFVGSDGAYETEAGRVSGSGYALVFNEFTVRTAGDQQQAATRVVDLTTSARSTTGSELFIGTGPAQQVTEYLRGVQRDVVSDLAGPVPLLEPIEGTESPLPPMNQDFWTDQAQGADPTVVVNGAGTETLVIMNADGSAPVSVDLRVGVRSPLLYPLGIAAAVLGGLLILLAIWVFVRAAKAKRRKHTPPPPASGAPAQAEPAPQTIVLPNSDSAVSVTAPMPVSSAPTPVPSAPAASPFAPPQDQAQLPAPEQPVSAAAAEPVRQVDLSEPFTPAGNGPGGFRWFRDE